MNAIIEKIHAELGRIYPADKKINWKNNGGWPKNENGSILYPPATDAQISTLEKKLKLPPSYKRFLKITNGWDHFWLDISLIGANGKEKRLIDFIKETVEEQKEDLEDTVNTSDKAAIRRWEAEDESNLYLANHIVVGVDEGGTLLVYDTRTLRKDGEMKLVYWTIDSGVSEEWVWSGVEEMLSWARNEVEAHAKKFGKKK